MLSQSAKSEKNIHLIILLVSASALTFLVVYFFASKPYVPELFVQARQNSLIVAGDIASLTGQSLASLEEISKADNEYKFRSALALVKEEVGRLKDARVKAIDLTKNLDLMARSASGIKPKTARDLAIEAISHEISLMSRLIVYNDMLSGLLQTLELKFSKDMAYDTKDVQNIIANLNYEAREISNLNNLFNEKMREFDEVIGK